MPRMIKLTKAQRRAVYNLWRRSQQSDAGDERSYREFRATVTPGFGWVGVEWCGMYIGIEPDGYTHS